MKQLKAGDKVKLKSTYQGYFREYKGQLLTVKAFHPRQKYSNGESGGPWLEIEEFNEPHMQLVSNFYRPRKTKMRPKNMLIKCKRWFQKTYGNTYHSVTIVDVTGKHDPIYIPMTYGYGDQCLDTARQHLVKLGLIKEVEGPTWRVFKELGIEYTISDVKRQRDLKAAV